MLFQKATNSEKPSLTVTVNSNNRFKRDSEQLKSRIGFNNLRLFISPLFLPSLNSPVFSKVPSQSVFLGLLSVRAQALLSMCSGVFPITLAVIPQLHLCINHSVIM